MFFGLRSSIWRDRHGFRGVAGATCSHVVTTRLDVDSLKKRGEGGVRRNWGVPVGEIKRGYIGNR